MDLKTKRIFTAKLAGHKKNISNSSRKSEMLRSKGQFFQMINSKKPESINFDSIIDQSFLTAESKSIKKDEKIELKEESKNDLMQIDESKLKEIRDFTKQLSDVKILNEIEFCFFESIKKNDYNNVKFALLSKPNLAYITDKVINLFYYYFLIINRMVKLHYIGQLKEII